MSTKFLQESKSIFNQKKNKINYLFFHSRKVEYKYDLKAFDYFKCIFIHIPRTGGVSLCLSIFKNLAGGHYSYRDYKKIYSSRTIETYFKFSMVRNPYDRLASAYYFLKSGGFNETDKEWSRSNISTCTDLEHFILSFLPKEEILNSIHFKPQFSYLTDSNNDINLDFIGRFENYHNDINVIKKKINSTAKIIHTNSSIKNKNIQYSPQMKDVVYCLYKDDFLSFGYKK